MSAFSVARISNTPGEEELEQLFNSVWKGYDVDLVSPVEGSISGGGSDAASSYTRSWQDSPTSPQSANSYAPGVSPNQPLPPPPPPTSTLPPPPIPPLPVAAASTSSSLTPPAHTPTTAIASESGKSTPPNGRARRPLPPTPGRPSSSGTPAAPPIPPPVVPPPSQLPEPEPERELEPVPEPDPQPSSPVAVIPPQHRALEESYTPPGSASAAGPSSTTNSPWSLRPRGIPLDLNTGPAIAIHHGTAPLSPAPEYFKEVEDDPEATAVLSEDDPRYSQPPPEPYPFPLHQPHEPTVPIAESPAHTWSRSSVTGYGEG
ncbi:hypothetical protein BDQ12DRAFT_509081 [Crucibulum laeve]|uniref:Uncharacterized protein n=1 Tax=Crucibulum laeve TaxID=68775 RepID=A0A5C3M530_9AGAR|nr:hypothetical protein BDQ12DRAFT_509081 [Crucibulum laeve]